MEKDHRPLAVLAFIVLVALMLRAIPVFFGIESTDIKLYREQAEALVSGRSLYLYPKNIFPYTPISLFYPVLCLKLSQTFQIPFHAVVKLFAILSDVAIIPLLYGIIREKSGDRTALISATLYALNPVTILVASLQGNIMPFVVFLMVVAYSFELKGRSNASALCLGAAIAWRSFPILILPYFVLNKKDNGQRARYLALTFLPTLFSFVPFLGQTKAMFQKLIEYSGGGIHHGPAAIVYGAILWLFPQILERQSVYHWGSFWLFSKGVFLISYLAYLRRACSEGSSLNEKIVSVFFLFYVFYAGVASQYLVWSVPFLLLLPERKIFHGYLVSAAYSIVTFYWVYFRDILFGRIQATPIHFGGLMMNYLTAEIMLTSVCLTFLFPRSFFRIRRPSGSC